MSHPIVVSLLLEQLSLLSADGFLCSTSAKNNSIPNQCFTSASGYLILKRNNYDWFHAGTLKMCLVLEMLDWMKLFFFSKLLWVL